MMRIVTGADVKSDFVSADEVPKDASILVMGELLLFRGAYVRPSGPLRVLLHRSAPKR